MHRDGLLFALGAVVCAFASDFPDPVYTRVTVTAERGVVQESGKALQVTHVVEPVPAATLGHSLEGTAGILVQQTTPGQVSPFLRGFTGYHVLNLIDGIRFNNTTFRSGPNQYLAYVEPFTADRLEAVLGPASSQFGSDSLGGSINVVTRPLEFADSFQLRADAGLFGGSADWSSGTDAQLEFSAKRWSWLLGGSAARFNDLRGGGGEDSRNVFRRLFGVSGITGASMPATGFSRFGLHTKASVAVSSRTLLTGLFQRSGLEDVRSYKDLYGGLGRLRSDFDPQRLTFGYLRAERMAWGGFESVSGTFSVNSQADGSVRQGLRSTDPITRDRVRVDVYGFSGQAARRIGARHFLLAGGEAHDEYIDAARWQSAIAVRPLYPDGSRYTTGAAFAQGSSELPLARIRLTYGGRFTRVGYAGQSFSDWTFHSGASWQATGPLGFHGIVSRGFRAPNLNDLGGIGLNDLGYEIPASEAPGALIGASAGENALPLGRGVESLKSEQLMNYEAGVRLRADRVYTRIQAFDAEFRDPIDRRTLLFPVGAVPTSLAGLPVTPIPQTAEQRAAGVVALATALDPRAVKAFVNDGRARYYGIETISEVRVTSAWLGRVNYSFLHGRQLNPNRVVRRLPPQQGQIALLYAPPSKRFWMEIRGTAAGAQDRLSGGDLDDERIGASRSRRDIAQFFGGDLAAPWVRNDVFTPTGETLSQIQNRVLPGVVSETARVPLYRSTAGWVAFDIVGGVRVGERMSLGMGVTNLLDRNYRTHGSGVDAPGANAFLRLRVRI